MGTQYHKDRNVDSLFTEFTGSRRKMTEREFRQLCYAIHRAECDIRRPRDPRLRVDRKKVALSIGEEHDASSFIGEKHLKFIAKKLHSILFPGYPKTKKLIIRREDFGVVCKYMDKEYAKLMKELDQA